MLPCVLAVVVSLAVCPSVTHQYDGWHWHQLDHMQIICTSIQTGDHATMPVPHHSVFTDRMPFWLSNQQYTLLVI